MSEYKRLGRLFSKLDYVAMRHIMLRMNRQTLLSMACVNKLTRRIISNPEFKKEYEEMELPKLKRLCDYIKKINSSGWKNMTVKELSKRDDIYFCTEKTKEIPEEIGLLVNLKLLNIHGVEQGKHAKLTKLPNELCQITNLEGINASWNNIRQIRTGVIPIRLTYIYLSGNNLDVVPEGILTLKNLEALHLSYNNIQEVPHFNMPNLSILSLDHNQIKTFSDYSYLKKLNHLCLSFNKIAKIPDGTIPNRMVFLSISNNRLKIIPLEILKLKKLEGLNLRNNKITKIPLEIKNMSSLTKLSMKGNEAKIPKCIEHMIFVRDDISAEDSDLE